MAHLERIQEHYLKRELLRLEIDHEVETLNDFKNIGQFGPPFSDDSKSDDSDNAPKYPVLQHVFKDCVKTFPFIANVDEKKFWQDTVQRFIEEFASKEISSSVDRDEETKRYKMGLKFKKLIQLYAAAGIKTTTDEGEAKIERVSERGVEQANVEPTSDVYANGYAINVVGVREVHYKKNFFSVHDTHYEFLIKTTMDRQGYNGAPEVYVARKYGDFKKLDRDLKKEYPGKQLPRLPSKNTTSTILGVEVSEGSEDGSDDATDQQPGMLKRERLRTTLRGYVRQLLEIPQLSRCQTFLEFLYRDQIKLLTKDEQLDIARRAKMDQIRLKHQVRFFQIATARARNLESFIAEFKQDLLAPNGVQNLFIELKEKGSIAELSPKFQKFIEWAVIEFAATLYHMFVAEDTSPEFYSQIRRIHGLVPYTVLKGILRYSNPVAMMKGVTDLFLAQPFGKRSLLQNIFWVILNDDIKGQDKLLTELKAKIGKSGITGVVDAYVDASSSIKNKVKSFADKNDVDVLMVVFEYSALFTTSTSGQKEQADMDISLIEVRKWYEEWSKSDPVDTRSADLYSQLREYLKLAIRKRDKDKMQEFWADDATIRLIKELVTVFYTPLLKVFKSASVHESVGDFEKFMSDLIKVVDRAELDAASSNPNQLVESFIALCTRHQESVFKFIHRVYQHDDGLFSDLMAWISGMIQFLREGNGKKLDMQLMFERAKEDPNIDTKKVVAEMDAIIQWMKDRREWRDTQATEAAKRSDRSTASVTNPNGRDWSSAMPSGGIEGTDFGFDANDLADFQAEEFELDLDGLQPPERPEITEALKLRPIFYTELCKVL